MLAAIEVQDYWDTLLVVAVVTSAFVGETVFGFWQAITGVKNHEDGKPPGRFVRWFVEGRGGHQREWRGWGLMGLLGVWFGGGVTVVAIPLALLVWALWVR